MVNLAIPALIGLAAVLFDANPSLYLFDKIQTVTSSLKSSADKSGSSELPSPYGGFYEGKKVWITGASSGIGRDLAVKLCGAGASVLASARGEAGLMETKGLCKGKGGKIGVLPMDVLGGTAVLESAVERAIAELGGVDILILNAGRSQRMPAVETPIGVTKDLMRLNFESTVELALLTMTKDDWVKKKKGHIAVTSSVAAKLPTPLSTSYSASKAALHGYFNGLRSEHPHLRVDLICPGPVATPIASNAHGLEGKAVEAGENKMNVGRAAQLMLAGMSGPSFLFYETWISQQPVLGFTAASQYLPGVVTALSRVVGPVRVKAFKEGKDLYKLSSYFSKD